MCLDIAIARPNDVLASGTHEGHEWMVIHNGSGYRCGYVKVAEGHPWHGLDHNDVDADVHGGLTFSAPDVACERGGPDNGYWFGFDCAHSHDAADPTLPGYVDVNQLLGRPPESEAAPWKTVRDNDYVIAECHRLCEQAREAAR